MEIWIRNQNRGSIISAKEIWTERSNKREGWVVIKANITDGNDGWIIGEYETEKRALEVLNEIHEYIEKQGRSEIIADENGIATGVKYYGKIYEMPEE